MNSTLKPSAGQLLEAIERTASGHIILLPAHQDVLFAAATSRLTDGKKRCRLTRDNVSSGRQRTASL